MSSRLCPILAKLMGRAKAPPTSCMLYTFRFAGSHIASQGLKGAGSPQEPPSLKTAHRAATRPSPDGSSTGKPPLGQPYSPVPGVSTHRQHLARSQRAHALRLAQSSRWPAGERVHPGVMTALSLTLMAASLVGWQGPARGMRAGVSGCVKHVRHRHARHS